MSSHPPREAAIALLMCEAVYKDDRQKKWAKLLELWEEFQGTKQQLDLYIKEYELPECLEAYSQGQSIMVGELTIRGERVIIIAFRGTSVVDTSFKDVRHDIQHYPIEWDVLEPLTNGVKVPEDGDAHDEAKKKGVHRGFLKRARGTTSHADTHYPGFPRDFVIEKIEGGAGVLLTGHSLGGAVAALITLGIISDLVKRDWSAVKIKQKLSCITFGAPYFAQMGIKIAVEERDLRKIFAHFQGKGDVVHMMYAGLKQVYEDSWLDKLIPDDVDSYVCPKYVAVGEEVPMVDNRPPHFCKKRHAVCRHLFMVSNIIAPHGLAAYIQHVLAHLWKDFDSEQAGMSLFQYVSYAL